MTKLIGDCILWQGAKSGNGYGYRTIREKGTKNKKNYYAHRLAYEKAYGEIPKNMIIMHKCDNPACVNPDHLTIGTKSDNTKDMINKNRHPEHMKKSELNTNRKLNSMQVAEIIKSDLSSRKIAPEYNVHHSVINRIRKNNGY